MLADPHLRAREMIVDVQHPARGVYVTVGNPIKLSASASDVKRSPLLGEHTDEVLREHGLSEHAIAALRAQGTIG